MTVELATSTRTIPSTGATRTLSEYLARASLDDLPDRVIDRVVHLVLDGLGCGLLAAQLPWSSLALRVVEGLEQGGTATVWGWDKHLPPPAAALINGANVQGFELDDYHQFGPLHSQACVLPSVLATAEHIGDVSGEDFLTAVAFGFEVGPRVGMALGGLSVVARGWHSGAVFGPIASAVGAGKLRGLDADGFEDAIGIAATQASGLMSAQYEAMVKRLHSGIASRSGLYAAALAAEGFSGIKRVLEREFGGYATAFAGPAGADLDRLTDGLGARWEIERIVVKPPYSCMAGLHAAIDGALDIRRRAGFDVNRIDSIQVGVAEAMFHHGGWTLTRPPEAIGAQMNIAYAIAVALIDGAAFVPQFSPSRLDAADVWRLIERTEVDHHPDIDVLGEDARWTVRLCIRSTDGAVFEAEVRQPRGGPERPMTNTDVRAKFRQMLELVVEDHTRIDALERVILDLRSATDLDELIDLLRPTVRNPLA